MSVLRALAAVTVTAAATLTMITAPAQAASLDASGDFREAAHIRSGPGQGYPSKGIGYPGHYLVTDCSWDTWKPVRNRATGVTGFVHIDLIYWSCN